MTTYYDDIVKLIIEASRKFNIDASMVAKAYDSTITDEEHYNLMDKIEDVQSYIYGKLKLDEYDIMQIFKDNFSVNDSLFLLDYIEESTGLNFDKYIGQYPYDDILYLIEFDKEFQDACERVFAEGLVYPNELDIGIFYDALKEALEYI